MLHHFNTYTCTYDLTAFLPLFATIRLFCYTTRNIDLSFITDISLIFPFWRKPLLQQHRHSKLITLTEFRFD